MMLSEYEIGSNVSRIIDRILSARDITVEEFEHGLGIGAGLNLNYDNGREFYIHEFPGNCSSLVISGIQGSLSSPYESTRNATISAIEATIEIAKELEYGALFASGNDVEMRNILVARFEFEVVVKNLRNPHSGNDNFFLMKVLK
jgi:hypothetical protein